MDPKCFHANIVSSSGSRIVGKRNFAREEQNEGRIIKQRVNRPSGAIHLKDLMNEFLFFFIFMRWRINETLSLVKNAFRF